MKQAVVFQPRCKLWSCPYCAEVNKGWWVAKTIHGAETLLADRKEIRFVTLTSVPWVSRDSSIKLFKTAWPKLRKRIARKAGYTVPYLLVTEQHLSGYLHVHMLLGAGLSSHWFHTAAFQCGLGYEAKSEKVDSVGKCAGYISKYISKSIDKNLWPHKFHRVRASNNWPKMPDTNILEGWEYDVFLDKGKATWEAHYLEDAGYRVMWTDSSLAFGLMGLAQLGEVLPFERDDL